jgi:hypothetical protein
VRLRSRWARAKLALGRALDSGDLLQPPAIAEDNVASAKTDIAPDGKRERLFLFSGPGMREFAVAIVVRRSGLLGADLWEVRHGAF